MTRMVALVLFLLAAPGSALAGDITVFAAASLRGALDDIADAYEGPVRLSYGGSGTMARQIAAGAPADVVVLANRDWMDWLAENARLEAHTVVARNRLVVIGPRGAAPITPEDLRAGLGRSRLAMGQRDAVPAGSYARQWLTATGQWDELAPHLAETDNVRAALALVAQGVSPLGITYATDAAAEPRVDVLYEIPQHTHDPILYPAAILTDAGRDFLAFLQGNVAAAILEGHGFTPVRE